ncbi:hypothetical protein PSEUBRA_005346 [Kalmanozyma brasiliensis GHG001]|uniref:uncharacterized protein n=1 Tax=Kalmanozyma brasiliensis (strain GHG001) TaxID=1365824 RepID=UPI002868215F|nr:uncharacterized protein PSEUBRA_005346 [Kalmanozyma brasiliensis GHG001]KAF6767516.1 hypothetical protein PSEUBRA_005346 [Kalmanozyma brasiliensis GHG001]
MKLASLLPAVVSCLAFIPFTVRSTPPVPAAMPESVARDETGATQYLWEAVQRYVLIKQLPFQYQAVQPAWSEFLHTEAALIIDAYYKAASYAGRAKFMALTMPERKVTHYSSPYWPMHRHTVALRLVKAFADKQLAEAERLAAERNAEHREWGKSLSLGSPSEHS